MASQLIELGKLLILGSGFMLALYICIAALELLLTMDFIRKHLGTIIVVLMFLIGCILVIIGNVMKG